MKKDESAKNEATIHRGSTADHTSGSREANTSTKMPMKSSKGDVESNVVKRNDVEAHQTNENGRATKRHSNQPAENKGPPPGLADDRSGNARRRRPCQSLSDELHKLLTSMFVSSSGL